MAAPTPPEGCPKCSSEEWGWFDADGDEPRAKWGHARCHGCGATWTVVYTFDRIDNLQTEEEYEAELGGIDSVCLDQWRSGWPERHPRAALLMQKRRLASKPTLTDAEGRELRRLDVALNGEPASELTEEQQARMVRLTHGVLNRLRGGE